MYKIVLFFVVMITLPVWGMDPNNKNLKERLDDLAVVQEGGIGYKAANLTVLMRFAEEASKKIHCSVEVPRFLAVHSNTMISVLNEILSCDLKQEYKSCKTAAQFEKFLETQFKKVQGSQALDSVVMR